MEARGWTRAVFLAALMAIIAAMAAPDAAESADAADIIMLSELESAPSFKPPPAYAEIPGFKFNYDSHPAKVESKGECEQICNAQPTCKSYSYAKKEQRCEWSTSKMQYDPDFVFNFKPVNGNSYHEFPGLVYRSTGWLKSEGKTNKECAALCDNAAACAAFSYRARDQLCLLSGHTIGFNEDFNYYEKQGAHKEFALRPHEIETHTKGALAKKAAAEAEKVAARVTAASAPAPAAAGPAPAPVIVQNGEPESVVAQRLQAVKDWAAQKIQQEDEETQLKIKAHEVDNKAAMEKQESADQAKHTEEEIAQSKAEAQKEADEEAVKARKKAQDMVEKVRLEAKEASVSAELSQAAKEKQQAEVTVEKANKQVDNIKEIDNKNDKVRKKEIQAKNSEKTNEDMQLRLIREKDVKANAIAIKSAVADKVAEVRKEMASKSKTALEETAERNTKMVDEERARKTTRGVEATDKAEAKTKQADKLKELEAEVAAANKKTADALIRESTTKSEMQLELKKANEDSSAKIAANELEAKGTSQESVSKAELSAQRSNEQLGKKAVVETDMESASKEAATKADTSTCDKELQQMNKDAVAAEKQVAESTSNLPDEAAATALQEKKTEWEGKINEKKQKCVPKAVDFTVDVEPLASASVQAPAPTGPEELIQLSEENPKPDPWPLDMPIRPTNPDGTPGPLPALTTEEARLRESNAATSRGMQPIEAGANEQIAYYKFKVAELRSGENVHDCKLKFEKAGGPESECIVKLTSCDYDATKLTYDTRPTIVNAVSSGGVFPQADGKVTVPLDTQLITTYLSNEAVADSTVCVEITGGQQGTPVYIRNVNLSLHIKKNAGVVDTTDRRRRSTPEVTVDRRRRSAIEDSRRRRSVQAIKDKAGEMYEKERVRLTADFESEMGSKLPAAIESKKVMVENELRAQYKGLVTQAVQAKLDASFNKDEMLEKEAEANKAKVEEALEKTFPPKYTTEKVKLESKMKAELTQQMTEEEEKIITAEATSMADDTVKSDTQALLDGAIAKKVKEDMPGALTAEVEKNAPKDYSTAIEEVVVQSVQDKTNEAVEKAVDDELQRRLSMQEDSVGSAAATAAVTNRMTELATQKIADEVQKEKSNGSPLGLKLNRGGSEEQDALQIIETRVAQMGSLLTDAERTQIEEAASKSAVSNLKTTLSATVNAEVRTPAFVDNIIRELKKSETERLTPIVKADVLKGLQTELEPTVRPEVTKKVTSEVMSQKDSVLKILHTALVQKNKADLMPKMNAKLSTTIPAALESAKFIAEVEAAQLELKEKLREEMEGELRTPLEKVSKLKIKSDEDQEREKIKLEVKAEKTTELNKMIVEKTQTSLIQPAVERDEENKMKVALAAKCKAETKRKVDLELGPTLKEKIVKKYQSGTMSEAEAFLKEHKEEEYRQQLKANMKTKVDQLVQSKLAGARKKLKDDLVEKLKKSLFEDKKAAAADKLKEDTEGMSDANAKAVELSRDTEMKNQAALDADQQATLELKGGMEKQLEDRLRTEETAQFMKQLEKDVEKRIQEEAKVISNKSLEEKYQDDLEAMEVGKTHVSDMAKGSGGGEVSAPDVTTAAIDASDMSTAAAALLTAKKKGEDEEDDEDELSIDTPKTNTTATDESPVNGTSTEEEEEEEEPVNATESDVNGTEANATSWLKSVFELEFD